MKSRTKLVFTFEYKELGLSKTALMYVVYLTLSFRVLNSRPPQRISAYLLNKRRFQNIKPQ